MLVLGIESTCDETAASVVEDGKVVHSQIISSQIDLHNIYGGVVPELACRRHMETIIPVVDEALAVSGYALEDMDLIAVAYGPGLVGPLFVGLQTAKGLALAMNKPIVGVNHVEAHLYAALMSEEVPVAFPVLGLVVSGGHTNLIKIDEIGSYTLIGQTVDDALGEAFDKVAKLLGLPYPGGPVVEALAQKGNPEAFLFKAGQCKSNPFNFSFSGLKTAVLYAVRDQLKTGAISQEDVYASFQAAAFKDLVMKTRRAAEEMHISTVLFGGGVTNNQELRRCFALKCPELKTIWPKKDLTVDNATMIAGLGYHQYQKFGPSDLCLLEAKTQIAF